MKKLLIVLLALPAMASANCNTYIVGFKGINNAFDQKAFEQYANYKSSCYKLFNWQQVDEAVNFVNRLDRPYEFYGFSKGAQSVAQAIPKVSRKPVYVLTIGAWHSTDVDFTKYNIKFNNYFDASGKKQRSPGYYVPRVPHMKMQDYVNKLMPLWPNW